MGLASIIVPIQILMEDVLIRAQSVITSHLQAAALHVIFHAYLVVKVLLNVQLAPLTDISIKVLA
jgi:hypothetical protein